METSSSSSSGSGLDYLERAVEMRTRYMVLLLLAEGPKTGYEVVRRMKELLSEAGGGASPGTIYPVLRALEKEGLVESSEEPHGARQRKVYRITGAGIEYLLRSAERALYILDMAMRLHLAALKGIRGGGRGLPRGLGGQLRRVVEKLESIRAETEELIALARRFLEEDYS